jgi:hypothetical protein
VRHARCDPAVVLVAVRFQFRDVCDPRVVQAEAGAARES